jgi:hypothetical protein
MRKGSSIPVGNTNRLMTDYEIFGYLRAREQPRFDEELFGRTYSVRGSTRPSQDSVS